MVLEVQITEVETDGQEFTFPAVSATAGQFYLSSWKVANQLNSIHSLDLHQIMKSGAMFH